MVRDLNGTPTVDATVYAVAYDNPKPTHHDYHRFNGNFSLTNVPTGTYEVRHIKKVEAIQILRV